MEKKILIIDDYKPLLQEVQEYLQYEGFEIITASNGAEGIQKAIIHKPDMILCDILMPELDGYEVFKTLQSIPQLSSIPFIFLTAKATSDDYRKGLSLGVDDYITKPYTGDVLVNSIKNRFEKLEKISSSKNELIDFIFNNPLLAILVYQNNKIIFANSKAKKKLNYETKEIQSLGWKKIILNEDFNIEKEIAELLSGIKKELYRIVAILTKDKKILSMEFFAKMIVIENQESVVIAMSQKQDPFIAKMSLTLEKFQDFFDLHNNKEISEEITKIIKEEIAKEESISNRKFKISDREKEVLELICKGLSTKEIAENLNISSKTVENHRAALLDKLKVRNTAELVSFAIQNRVIDIEKLKQVKTPIL